MEKALQKAIGEITEIATSFGLDFYPMRYEICPAHIIYTFGAYGMPTRFAHWSFGKQFHRMKLQYDLGLSQIYELVINSNPCYAFLLDTNSLTQNKLIIAHVLAHCDFFKNNVRFSNTRRDMVESMTATAERIASYEQLYGKEEVERFLDAVLAIQEHIDPAIIRAEPKESRIVPKKKYYSLYDDLFDEVPAVTEELKESFPQEEEKDLLYFIEQHSTHLAQWQRDILTMMREEMLYFWPQLETKIMNEGWATFWHQRILRELDLTIAETIDYAKLNAGVIQPSKTSINPYYLGLKIFEHIEEYYNNPTEEMVKRGAKKGAGRDKIFEVREIESDTSFIRNYLTKELIEQEDLYVFAKAETDYRIVDKGDEAVRNQLVSMRINGGFPYIVVTDGDYKNRGELYLKHRYEGMELDQHYLEQVLRYIYKLWGRPVHLETTINNENIIFSSVK